MDDKDKVLIEEFKRSLSEEIKKHVKRIIVFGSRVRGDIEEDSDLDVVALIDVKNPEIIEFLDECAYQVMWNHDFKTIISLKVLVESEFYDAVKRGFSFYRNVLQEGISV